MWTKANEGRENSATQKFPIERKNSIAYKTFSVQSIAQRWYAGKRTIILGRYTADFQKSDFNEWDTMISHACRAKQILDANYCFYTIHTNL